MYMPTSRRSDRMWYMQTFQFSTKRGILDCYIEKGDGSRTSLSRMSFMGFFRIGSDKDGSVDYFAVAAKGKAVDFLHRGM